MKIERNLNLVMPVQREDGTTMHVHSAPISREVFEEFYLVLSQTFTTIMQQGLGDVAGPRVAAMALRERMRAAASYRDPVTRQDVLDDAAYDRLQRGIFGEMRRLSNVLVLGPAAWETLPFDEAVKREYLDADDVSEVENALVFFTLNWRVHRKSIRGVMTLGGIQLWGGSTTSSNVSEFAASLPTSTPAVSSGARPTGASSVPS